MAVDGVVGENGAFYFAMSSRPAMIRKYMKSRTERAADRERLNTLQSQIISQFPARLLPATRLTAKPISPLILQRMFHRFPGHSKTHR
jgi:hypothetical protein